MEKLSFKKLRKEQAQSVASEKSDATPKTIKGQPVSNDATASDNTQGNTDDMVTPTQELLLSKIDELVSLLKQRPNSGNTSVQICEQDMIQLRNIVATGVKDKLDTCLPPLVEKCIPKQEDNSENIKITKDYMREVSQNYYEIVGLATGMDNRSQIDLESRQEQNRHLKKMRTNQNTALNAAVRYGKQLKVEVKNQVDRALHGDKPQQPKEPHADCTASEAYRYIFWQLPKYYLSCFVQDRHTKVWFRSMVLCVMIILLSTLGFMAHDLGRFRMESTKYQILRNWVSVDNSDPQNKVFVIDGLYTDQENNADDIQRLQSQIKLAKRRLEIEKMQEKGK